MPRIVASALALVQVLLYALGLIAANPRLIFAQSAGDGFDPGADGPVTAIAVQPADGKVLVAGSFTMLGGGGSGTIPRLRIGRVHPDGSIDQTFDPGLNGTVNQLLVQPDGKILVAGDFTEIAGATRHHLARLNTDGSVDVAFAPNLAGAVNALGLQDDGRIVVGGTFTWTADSVTRHNLLRVTSTGMLDPSFTGSVPGRVDAIAIQRDTKIVIGGLFDTVNIQGRSSIARLNADGSTDLSFNPGADANVRALALQPDGNLLIGGAFSQLGEAATVSRPYLGRITRSGALDAGFAPSLPAPVQALVVQSDGKILCSTGAALVRLHASGAVDNTFANPISGDGLPIIRALALTGHGSILVGGAFSHVFVGGGTQARSNIARIGSSGVPDVSFASGANGDVRAVALQRDGRVLLGGAFTSLQSGTTPAVRNHIGRLTETGDVDATFNSGSNGAVLALTVQPDDHILVGGAFTTLGGSGTGISMRSRLGRLTPDGGIDTSFYSGANGPVHAILLDRFGRIFVAGAFTTLGSGTGVTGRGGIGMLRPDGAVESWFNPGTNGAVNTIALQKDISLILGGTFTMAGGGATGNTVRHNLARLDSEGELDTTFNPGANGPIHALVLQPDGRILVAGAFTTIGGGGTGVYARSGIARLNPDGSVDMSFAPGVTGGTLGVTTMALQTDGSVVIGGDFTAADGTTGPVSRKGLARITADGRIDPTFDPGANAAVLALAQQADGKVIAGGAFTMLGGGGSGTTSRQHVGRLGVNGATAQSVRLEQAGEIVRWSRSGISPELTQVFFEWSADGASYTRIGEGTAYGGTWLTSASSLPTGRPFYVRARGSYRTGHGGGSMSATEVVSSVFIPAPQISPSTLPEARWKKPYSVTLTLPGAFGPALFELFGFLPTGMTFSDGVIAGTPQETGNYSLVVTGTDTVSGIRVIQRMDLVVGSDAPAPTISNVSPSVGPAVGSTPVTIRGANFQDGAIVIFDNVWIPSVVLNSTTITMMASSVGLGTVDVTVTNPDNQSATLQNAFTFGSFDTRIAFGLGPFPNNGGHIALARGSDISFQATTGVRLPWDAYNATGGSLRLAAGDVDGDGLDEIVAGVGAGGNGWIAILDDEVHGHALMRWIRVSWPTYNAVNGEVWPAVGNLDGDAGAEIVAGLGSGGGGWFEIFDDASTSFASRGWQRVGWPVYNGSGDGATHPAIGNVDGVGGNEIIIGLGSRSNGWIQVIRDEDGDFGHYAWIQVPWATYNAANGTTFPAAGDMDGDGKAEIVAGLGRGGGGWLAAFRIQSVDVVESTWIRSSWSHYNQTSGGETHPALGNVDIDPRAELVIGLDRLPKEGGWFEILDDATASFAPLGWHNLEYSVWGVRASGVATFPAIGLFR